MSTPNTPNVQTPSHTGQVRGSHATHDGGAVRGRAAMSARRAAVVVAAAVTAVTGWAVVHLIFRVDLTVAGGAGQSGSVREVGAAAAAVTAVVVGLAGWAVLSVLERRAARARRTWTVIALSVLVVSLVGTSGATDAAARVGLVVLHVVVGAVLVLGLRRTASPGRRPL